MGTYFELPLILRVKKMKKINKFAVGSGCYKCVCCERLTRAIGEDSDNTTYKTKEGMMGTCFHCYEMGGIENEFSDCGLKVPTERMMKDWEIDFAECVKLGGNPCTDFRKNYPPKVEAVDYYKMAGDFYVMCKNTLQTELAAGTLTLPEFNKLMTSIYDAHQITVMGLKEQEKNK